MVTARFVGIDGERAKVEGVSAPSVPDEQEARAIIDATTAAVWSVRSVEKKERRSNPYPPFITSTLQQSAAAKLGFSVKRTMGVAQRLYEGVDLGADGSAGLITYMRTDSTRVAPEAIAAAREYIAQEAGQRVFAGAAQRLSLEERCAGCARSDPADRSRNAPEQDQAVPERRAIQAVQAGLAAVCGFADRCRRFTT